MNLNEALAKKKSSTRKNRFKNSNSFGINKIREQNPEKIVNSNTSTTSSEVNWGTKHICVPNTPQTARKSGTSSKTSTEDDSRIIVALTEGRGEARHEVGLAAICVSKPHLVLCQISDNQSYVNTLTKINLFDPSEIIVPHTFLNSGQENRLIKKVEEKFPNRKLTTAPRSTFNKMNGKDILSDLCIPSLNGILLILQHRYYAVAAASALITYIQDCLYVYYGAGTLKIEYQESEGHAIIDISTADNLELVRSAKPANGNKYSSLFGVMNHCKTKIGTRTLRSSILQPLFDTEAIAERISCVTTLMNEPAALISIQALLMKVSNIDHILSIGTIVLTDPQKCSNRQLNYLLTMNSLLDLMDPLKDVLSNLENSFFIQLRETLENEGFSYIKKMVRNTIQEGAHPATGQAGVFQRCFAVKPGINGLLDLVRRTFSERLKDMQEYVQLLADKYGFTLALSNNQTKGYHIIISLSKNQRSLKKSDLPAEFIQVQRLVDKFTAKTPELMNLSTRINDIMSDILKISNTMIHTLLIELKQYIPLFHQLCEQMAYLDVLQSLAETSLTRNYVKPEFGEFTELINARHPLLDFLLPTNPVPNSITSSTDFNIHIITGPNGSGKSILIRQLVLLQVMAQVGCYVPAESAHFRPADQIFARIYLEDNMEYGASAFVLEDEEILARCDTCGYISQQSNVLKHVRDKHSSDNSGTEYFDDSEATDLENANNAEEKITATVAVPVEKVVWTKPQVLLLLELYNQFEHKFQDRKTTHRAVWRLIPEKMKERNYSFSADICENKFKNLKKISDNNKMSGRGSINWPFFEEMDKLFRKNPEICPLSTCSSLEGTSNKENDSLLPSSFHSNNVSENINVTTATGKTSKRRANGDDEPEWFKHYRKECQKRHEDKMNRQDKFLSLMEKLVESTSDFFKC